MSLGKHFPTFRFIFMDVFSGPLGREGKGKSFLRNVFKISRKDPRRHLPEDLNPHAVTVRNCGSSNVPHTPAALNVLIGRCTSCRVADHSAPYSHVLTVRLQYSQAQRR